MGSKRWGLPPEPVMRPETRDRALAILRRDFVGRFVCGVDPVDCWIDFCVSNVSPGESTHIVQLGISTRRWGLCAAHDTVDVHQLRQEDAASGDRQLAALLGARVAAVEIGSAVPDLTLTFDDGRLLQIACDDPRYEALSVLADCDVEMYAFADGGLDLFDQPPVREAGIRTTWRPGSKR